MHKSTRAPHSISGLEDANVDISVIDSFLKRARARQPVHPHITDAVLSGIGMSPTDFACLTQLEKELILLYSLAVRKNEISTSQSYYEPWGSSCSIWQGEGSQGILESKLLVVPLISSEIRRLPEGEKEAFTAEYSAYIQWLNQMTGNDKDPIPEEVLIRVLGSDVFPEIPRAQMYRSRAYYVSPDLMRIVREG